MKIEIIGNSAGAGWLALSVRALGWSVRWSLRAAPGADKFLQGPALRGTQLRPLRMTARTARSWENELSAETELVRQLRDAPRLKAWLCSENDGDDELVFEPSVDEMDRWLCEESLLRELMRAAARRGVRVIQNEHWPLPDELDADALVVADLGPDEWERWGSRAPRFAHPVGNARRAQWQTQIALPRGRLADSGLMHLAFREGAAFCLEPQAGEGFVLTASATRAKLIQNALAEFEGRPGGDHSPWRALLLMNPGTRRLTLQSSLGPSGFASDRVIPLGAALGELPAFGNGQRSEAIRQAERLYDVLAAAWREGLRDGQPGLLRAKASAWAEREQLRFRARFAGATVSQAFLFSPRFRRGSMALAGVLPRSFRRAISSPV